MLADHRSAPHVQWRAQPAIHAERFASRGGADNVDNRVYRADLVKMHLFDGDGVDGGLGFSEQLKGANGVLFHYLGEWRGVNDFDDCRQGTVRCMPVLVGMRLMRVGAVRVFRMIPMRMAARWRVRGQYIHFGCGKPATAHLAHLQMRAHVQRGCSLRKSVKGEGNARIHKGAQQHIAAYAGKALKVSNSHRSVILYCRLRAAPSENFNGQDRIQ